MENHKISILLLSLLSLLFPVFNWVFFTSHLSDFIVCTRANSNSFMMQKDVIKCFGVLLVLVSIYTKQMYTNNSERCIEMKERSWFSSTIAMFVLCFCRHRRRFFLRDSASRRVRVRQKLRVENGNYKQNVNYRIDRLVYV